MHINTIGIYLNFDPYLTFVDPSRKCLTFFKGATQLKIVRYSSGNTKTLSNLCSQDLVTGPTGWSPTMMASFVQHSQNR